MPLFPAALLAVSLTASAQGPNRPVPSASSLPSEPILSEVPEKGAIQFGVSGIGTGESNFAAGAELFLEYRRPWWGIGLGTGWLHVTQKKHASVVLYSNFPSGSSLVSEEDVESRLFNRIHLVPEAFLYLPVARNLSLCVGAGLGPSWISASSLDTGTESNPGSVGRVEFGIDATSAHSNRRVLIGVDIHSYSIAIGNRTVGRNSTSFSIRALFGFSLPLDKNPPPPSARPSAPAAMPSRNLPDPPTPAAPVPQTALPAKDSSQPVQETTPDTTLSLRRFAILSAHVQEFHDLAMRHRDPDTCQTRRLVLAYTIDSLGTAQRMRVLRSDTRNPRLDSAMGHRLGALDFPQELQGPDSCLFLLPRGKHPLLVASTNHDTLPWNAQQIDANLFMQHPSLQRLYAKALENDPEIAGNLRLRFSVAPDGKVLSDTVTGSSTGNAAFDQSVADLLAATRFDSTFRPQSIERTYAFEPHRLSGRDAHPGWLVAASLSNSISHDSTIAVGYELSLFRTGHHWRLGATFGQENAFRGSVDASIGAFSRTYLLPQTEAFTAVNPNQALSMGLAIGPAWMSSPSQVNRGYPATANNPAFMARLVAGWDILLAPFHARLAMGIDRQAYSLTDASGRTRSPGGYGFFSQMRMGFHFRDARPNPSFGQESACPLPWRRVLPQASSAHPEAAAGTMVRSSQAPAPAIAPHDTSAGSRTPESILRVIRAHVGGFRYTYEKYLRQNPNLGGKISLKFVIAPSGEIIAMSLASSSSGDDALDQEIMDKARQMRFDPIPRGNVTVTYAFVLSRE